ncbi:MAG: hypothetical protein Q7V57_02995 [Actinomycetota bacterium]|nr:hypothetical protein [Actinomycetota bacterium]
MSYVADLGLTLVVEVPVVVGVTHAVGVAARRSLPVAIAANLLTHPVLWFVAAPWGTDHLGITGLLLAEGCVVAVEAAVFACWLRPRPRPRPRRNPRPRLAGGLTGGLAGWLALLANAMSVAVGIVVH